MNELIASLVDGEAGDRIPIADRGLQYGDGLFETVAVVDGTPLLWERHVERLLRGAARLAIAAPTASLLMREAQRLCRDAQRAVLKIMLIRGGAGRGYAAPAPAAGRRILSLWKQTANNSGHAATGIDVRLCRTRLGRNPALAGLKHLNRLEQVLARAEWGDDCAEGLMQDVEGDVIEGTMSNLFLVTDGVLTTPDLSHCGVEGVMRGVVLEHAAASGIPQRVGRVGLNDVQRAEELFLTNSLIGIWPVRRLERDQYRIGAVTRALQQAIRGVHGDA